MIQDATQELTLSREELEAIPQMLGSNPSRLLAFPKVRTFVAENRFEKLSLEREIERSPMDEKAVRTGAIEHNLNNFSRLPAFDRTAELAQPVMSLNLVKANVRNMRVLCVGPRSEIELFALMGWGFASENIEALDLISYSPLVTAGEMHAMPYEDESFDLVILG